MATLGKRIDSGPWCLEGAASGFGILLLVGVRERVDQNGTSKTGVICACNLSIHEAEAEVLDNR